MVLFGNKNYQLLFAESYPLRDFQHPVFLKQYSPKAEREIEKKISAVRCIKMTEDFPKPFIKPHQSSYLQIDNQLYCLVLF